MLPNLLRFRFLVSCFLFLATLLEAQLFYPGTSYALSTVPATESDYYDASESENFHDGSHGMRWIAQKIVTTKQKDAADDKVLDVVKSQYLTDYAVKETYNKPSEKLTSDVVLLAALAGASLGFLVLYTAAVYSMTNTTFTGRIMDDHSIGDWTRLTIVFETP